MDFKDIRKVLLKGRQVAGLGENLGLFDSDIGPNPNNPFSIETFKARLNEEAAGVAKNNKYLVTFIFGPDSAMAGDNSDYASNVLQFMCTSAVLPGLSFTTHETRRHGYGPIDYYPSSPLFNEIPMTFTVDGKGRTLEFFHSWANRTMMLGSTAAQKKESATTEKETNAQVVEGALPYELYYRDQYKCECIITVLNDRAEEIFEYQLFNTFLTSIGDTPVAWANDGIMELQCTFRCEGYKVEKIHMSKELSLSRGLSLYDKLAGIATTVQTVIGAARKPSSIADVISIVKNTQTISNVFGN